MIDLHTHTTASDGTLTPIELIDSAIACNLTAVAITDHDTIDGLQEAAEYIASKGMDPDFLVNGIELSTSMPEYIFDIHILGLFIDPHNEVFKEGLSAIVNDRHQRNLKMLERIREEGFDLTYEELPAAFGDCIITRSHVAELLVEKGYFRDTREVFMKLIGNGMPAHVPRQEVHTRFAIDFILKSGGIPFLAHPVLYNLDSNTLYALLDKLKGYGLVGIESMYSQYTAGDTRAMRHLAKRFGLLEVGGSDFHGGNRPGNLLGTGYGNLDVPDDWIKPMKDYLNAAQ